MNTVRKGLSAEQVEYIKENCPTAYKSYINYYTNYLNINMMQAIASDPSIDPTTITAGITQLAGLMLTDNVRDLYDFFDEKGIEVYVELSCGTPYIYRRAQIYDRKNYKILYSSDADNKDQLLEIPSEEYSEPNRITCEQYSFIKAFEILEERINGK